MRNDAIVRDSVAEFEKKERERNRKRAALDVEQKREKARARNARENPFQCGGLEKWGCLQHVALPGRFCGRCKGRYSFLKRQEAERALPYAERKEIESGRRKARIDIKLSERAFYLGKGPPKLKATGFHIVRRRG